MGSSKSSLGIGLVGVVGGLVFTLLVPVWGSAVASALLVAGTVLALRRRASKGILIVLVAVTLGTVLGTWSSWERYTVKRDAEAAEEGRREAARLADERRRADALARLPETLSALNEAVRAGRWEEADRLWRAVDSVKPNAPGLAEAKAAIDPEMSKISAARDAEAKKAALEKERAAKKAVDAEAARRSKALARLRAEVDDIRGVTFYWHPSTRLTSSHIAAYFGVHNEYGIAPLRLSLRFVGTEWLFVQSVIVKADDERFTIGEGRWERDNDAGHVWEWVDEPVGPVSLAALQAVVKAKSAKMRFQGQHYNIDRPIPDGERRAIKEMIEAYEAVGGPREPRP